MKRSLVIAVVAIPVLLLSGCERAAFISSDRLSYPVAQRVSQTDILHGTPVSDPYRWLEADVEESAEDIAGVSSWLAAQRSLSAQYFAAVSSHSTLRDNLARLWGFERREAPRRFGERWFLFRNTDSADHYALAMQIDPSSEPVTVLDPTQWSDPQTLLAAVSISPDGRFLAWLQTDARGGERQWRLRDLNAAPGTPEIALDWLDVDDIVWRSDSAGFYYSAGAAAVDSAVTGIYFHTLEGNGSDETVYVSSGILRVQAAVDERWLIATEETGTTRYLLLDLERRDSTSIVLGEGGRDALRFLDARNGRLFLLSTLDNPAGSVVSIDPAENGVISSTVVAAGQRQILRALPLESGVLVEYLEAAVSILEHVATDGSRHPLALPGPGRISSLYQGERDNEVFFSFSTLTDPGGVYRLNILSGASSVLFTPAQGFAPEDFVVVRVDVPAGEVGSIPVLVAGRRDRMSASDSNLLLEVYGGFGIAMNAGFSIARLGWMAEGGIYAMVAVRGGGEMGPQWHEQALGVEKHRSIDDLLLVAQYFQDEGYVDRGRLALMGASHGAMLAAAAMNRAPSQFAAVVLSAGPMDMVRYAELGGAESWQDEYGSTGVAEEFVALHGYSPYHNVRTGTVYPAVLVLTSETDEVVAPAHSYKYTARLQGEVDAAHPVLLRIQQASGHLDTGTVDQLIDQYAERWAFLLHELGR